MGKANGTIRCCISSGSGRQPRIDRVAFTPDPDHSIKHGKREFVAFVPADVPKAKGTATMSTGQQSAEDTGKSGERAGFVLELCNGSIELELDRLDPYLLSQAALHNTKVTVVVSEPSDGRRLKALVVPAE